MRLARLLQQNGYHVILTRNEDKGLYTGNQEVKGGGSEKPDRTH